MIATTPAAGRARGLAAGAWTPDVPGPEIPPPEPSDLEPAVDEPDDVEPIDLEPLAGPPDDSNWDVFIPDDDQRDPLPEEGDFWITFDGD